MPRKFVLAAVLAITMLCTPAWSQTPAPVDPAAQSLRLAVNDLKATYGPKYPKADEFLRRLAELEKANQVKSPQFDALRQEALLANPLLDFDKLLMVKRAAGRMGLPQNWQDNTSIGKTGYGGEIVVLSPVSPAGKVTTLFKPQQDRFVGDLNLHFDGDRLLFSMPSEKGPWQVFEIRTDGTALRQVTPGDQGDVDNFDACYLADGRIIFCSTACQQGIPCVTGSDKVSLLYQLSADGKTVRQLTFDQDHSWDPTPMADGRIMYSRWEYSDLPHYFSRLIFSMYPDGTNQAAFYGSNAYWPNSLFYARPIPGHPTQFVAIASGHHGVPRMGELVLFDAAKGRREDTGVVQRIPGYGKKVPPTIADTLVDGSWPKFLHPAPLSDKYFLVSCQPNPQSPWGVYLVDIFDNMLPLCVQNDSAMLEPLPLRKTPAPPAVPDRVDLASNEATVYLSDVYVGQGLENVPRGSVKKLRLYSPHYSYWGMGGHQFIGIDGPWDVKRILGTVPVRPDGSASFRVPANTPIAVQPLDENGQALQLMRSWFTAMPGEKISCVGCHERTSSTPPAKGLLAMKEAPSAIEPWHGAARGFGFPREVQPVLDKYCVGCHDGKDAAKPDFRLNPNGRGRFTSSYSTLHRYVWRPTPESDYHLLPPGEYLASTSELVQMLRKGHHGVKLDADAWDRLITWIDLNVPDHGSWHEATGQADGKGFAKRRAELSKLYANLDTDLEAVLPAPAPVTAIMPLPIARPPQAPNVTCPGWPFDAAEAQRRQKAAAGSDKTTREIDLGGGVKLELVLVPAGEFVMGDAKGSDDEKPAVVKVDQPFWMGRLEITNQQFNLFDARHESRFLNRGGKDQSDRGISLEGPRQPVVRVSWKQALEYCKWLSRKTGESFTLPTEAQWEFACRAGTASATSFGDGAADFAPFANLADVNLWNMVGGQTPQWRLAATNFNDGATATADVGRYRPNAFGLNDMHGNAWEWTRSLYRPYPYQSDGRDDEAVDGERVVRGGSFYDRPARARSAFRLSYAPWRQVFNVGFRVTCPVTKSPVATTDRR